MTASSDTNGPRIVGGVEVSPKGDGHTWIYVPSQPSLERSDTGSPLLQIIEAGPVAFLAATVRLALSEPDHSALLAQLQADDPTATDLQAAPISVERMALEVWTGSWTAIAESAGSGAFPWTAALTASLAAETTAALKAAAAGTADRARLVARFQVGGSSGQVREGTASGQGWAETSAGSAGYVYRGELDATVEPTASTSREVTADLSRSFVTTDH